MPSPHSRGQRVAKLAFIFFVLDMLLDWRSVARWDWGHIRHLSGAFDIAARLAIRVSAAVLFGLMFGVVFRWLWPRFLRWNSERRRRPGAA
jgi:hypothetical protein